MSYTDVKELGVFQEQANLKAEIKNKDLFPPIVMNIEDEQLATGKSSLVSSTSKLNINRFRSTPGLPPLETVGPATRDETYNSESDMESNKTYPSLVMNAALRWYEIDLQQGGLMLNDWIQGQFQVFQSLRTFQHQRVFLRLHQKNVKRLFLGMFNLLSVMTRAGIAHNNISLETIMLLSAPVSSVRNSIVRDNDDLFTFIESPSWCPLLTSFGCSSLAESYIKQAPCLKQEQFHSLFKENCPVKFDHDDTERNSKKVANIILSYSRDHSNYARYLAPESNPVAPKGDLWSLGVLLWECLTNILLWENPKCKKYQDMVEKKGGFKTWFIKHVQSPGKNNLLYFVPKEAVRLLDLIFKSEGKRISLNDVLKHSFFYDIHEKPARTSVDLMNHGLELQFLLSQE